MTEEDKPTGPVLNAADLVSPTWRKLKAHIEAQQLKLRTRNESDLDATATAKLRGELKGYRNLLALATAPAVVADAEAGE